MPDKIVTRDLVQKAVSDLKDEKSAPTVRKTMEKLGFGTFNTVMDFLKELELDGEKGLKGHIPSTDGGEVPLSIAALAKPVLAEAGREAEARYRSRVAKLEEALADTASKLKAERDSRAVAEKEKEKAVLEINGFLVDANLADFKRETAKLEQQAIANLHEDLQKKNKRLEEEFREITDSEKREESAIITSLREENSRLQELLDSTTGRIEWLEKEVLEGRGTMKEFFNNSNISVNLLKTLEALKQISQKISSLESSEDKGASLKAASPKSSAPKTPAAKKTAN